MNTIVIVVRGGLVEAVYSNANAIVTVMDTDAGYYAELTEDELQQHIREECSPDTPLCVY